MVTSDPVKLYEYEGEDTYASTYPIPIDIDDGIERNIKISQEIFGVVTQYQTEFEVMRFTLHNTLKDGIQVQVMSLGAALTGVSAPDRKGYYEDVVLGFDSVDHYYSPLNPGFGRITSLCPLPYNLEKVVWDWDFNRDEGSVTFSTNFYGIDLVLHVRYTLTECNEIIVDMKACGSKILPVSLTNQVYWNMSGHYKGEEALSHHALSINSDRIWKHINHKLKNFFAIHDTVLDFRQPTLMDLPEVFGDKKFEHVYVVSKGCKQSVSFVARLIHPRSCRYVEIFSDQPWVLCNTLNKFPRRPREPKLRNNEGKGSGTEKGEESDDRRTENGKEEGNGWRKEEFQLFCDVISGLSVSDDIRRNWDAEPDVNDGNDLGEAAGLLDIDPCASEDEKDREEELDEIPGKEGCSYQKYGGFCVTPLNDLTDLDPILRAGDGYSHRIIYKLGIYRRYMKKSKKQGEEAGEEENDLDDVVDIDDE